MAPGQWTCSGCKRIFARAQAKWGCPYCLTSAELKANGMKVATTNQGGDLKPTGEPTR